jgi:hypothetical protein
MIMNKLKKKKKGNIIYFFAEYQLFVYVQSLDKLPKIVA